VASDHGFGGAGNKVVYLNQWLERYGFQQASRRPARSRVAAAAKRFALHALPPHVQVWGFRLGGGRWASRLESRSRFAGIDWAGTRAFSEELGYFPSVWLNLKGREPDGIVDPADYERVRDDICAAAAALCDPEHGGPIVCRAWRREELYDGPWTRYAPDIVLEFRLDRGYSYACLASAAAPTSETVRVLESSEWTGGKLATLSGSHRPNGLFLLGNTPLGAPRHVAGAQIADMAATILSLCGLQPPAEFDGRIIDPVICSGRYSMNSVTPQEGSDWQYTRAEGSEIAARLSALGYLE
jgi:predicted AlkP superfamily phosphohydrolase/phosphomutase